MIAGRSKRYQYFVVSGFRFVPLLRPRDRKAFSGTYYPWWSDRISWFPNGWYNLRCRRTLRQRYSRRHIGKDGRWEIWDLVAEERWLLPPVLAGKERR